MKILDKNWRLNNLYNIVDKNGDRITFQQNNIQQAIREDSSPRKAILKARQFGVSTGCLIDMFDDTIFNRNMNCCILAHEQDSIRKLFRIVRRAYEFLPAELRPELSKGGGSMYEMFFPSINSRIYCDLESRGDTIHRLHVSECAFMRDSGRLKSTLQAVPLETGRVTIETTPNGIGNFFYDLWIDPAQPYKKLFFPWFMFPAYRLKTPTLKLTEEEVEFTKKAQKLFNISIDHEQLAFRRAKRAELKGAPGDKSRVLFEQEYPEDDQSCFLSSGDSVMDLVLIKEMINELREPIKDETWLKVYELCDRSSEYVIGADTAEGSGGDYSVGVAVNVKTKTVAGIVRGQWKPHEFAHRLKQLAQHFHIPGKGSPLLAVERNNHGHAVLLELYEHIQYPHLYQHQDDKLGWKTDMVTRPIMFNTFIQAVESRQFIVTDRDILGECLTLVNINGKIQAADTKHDDCVVAAAISLQMALKSSTLGLYENIAAKILT